MLFEEFISESYGRDLRFYSIRGEAVACMQRTSQGDFRANVALGASVEPYPVTSGIRTIAADIYEQTGLDFLGIDLLFGREKPYFCEINVMPGLEGIEKASGINVAGKIIETIQSDLHQRLSVKNSFFMRKYVPAQCTKIHDTKVSGKLQATKRYLYE